MVTINKNLKIDVNMKGIKHWTKDEINLIRSNKYTNEELSKKLDRTITAIEVKKSYLKHGGYDIKSSDSIEKINKVSSISSNNKKWIKNEILLLKKCEHTIPELAILLSRNEKSVKMKYSRLGYNIRNNKGILLKVIEIQPKPDTKKIEKVSTKIVKSKIINSKKETKKNFTIKFFGLEIFSRNEK